MIRVAIIGAGIGAEHLAGYRALPDRFSVKTLCDLDTDRATAVAGGDAALRIVSDIAGILVDDSPSTWWISACRRTSMPRSPLRRSTRAST
jgi:predicted dehydrogenase